MSRLFVSSLALAALALSPQMATAQNQSYTGAFQRHFPEASARLNAFSSIHANLLETLHSNPTVSVAQLDGSVYDGYVGQAQRGAERMASMTSQMSSLAQAAPSVATVLERTHALQRELYDIFSDPNLADPHAVAEQAIDRYLSQPEVTLPARPKSMMIMHNQPYSMAFMMEYPRTNGLMWASHWLELAVFDPLLFYTDDDEREDGIETVLERFDELLSNPPESFPQEMPTPAAITPELVRLHPRAAAIFDNLYMFHDIVADILNDGSITDKRGAIADALDQFRDPTRLAVSDYNWVVEQLRSGIYFQGGPAIGRLERPERNMRMDHADHGGSQMVMPGMPGPAAGAAPPPQDNDNEHQHR